MSVRSSFCESRSMSRAMRLWMLCYLRLRCHFWPFNRCRNSPPPVQKKIVRHQRTRYRKSIDRCLLAAAQLADRAAGRFSRRACSCKHATVVRNWSALGAGQGPARLPDLCRRGAVQSPRAGAGVGLLTRRLDHGAGPDVRMAEPLGQALRSRFQRANRCLDRAIVRRPPRRREEHTAPPSAAKSAACGRQ